jgi:hypothetical protein
MVALRLNSTSDAILQDHAELGRVLTACSVLDDYREKAEAVAKERHSGGRSHSGLEAHEPSGGRVRRSTRALGST